MAGKRRNWKLEIDRKDLSGYATYQDLAGAGNADLVFAEHQKRRTWFGSFQAPSSRNERIH
jgi:hypothetical protein